MIISIEDSPAEPHSKPLFAPRPASLAGGRDPSKIDEESIVLPGTFIQPS